MFRSKYICPYCIKEEKTVRYKCHERECVLNSKKKRNDDGTCKLKIPCIFKSPDGRCSFSLDSMNRCSYYNDKVCSYSGACPRKSDTGNCTYSHATHASCVQDNTFSSRNGKCPQCNTRSTDVVCPDCHKSLPESTLNGEDLIIAIVGSRASGKSNYIGVLIRELQQRICCEFNASFEVAPPQGDSWQRYKNTFYSSLYGKNPQSVDQTDCAFNMGTSYEPLMFSFRMQRGSGFFRTIRTFTFVFFDTAGETLENYHAMEAVNRYIAKADAIIFLVDPLQLAETELLLDEELRKKSIRLGNVASPDEIVTHVSHLIRTQQNINPNSPIRIPTAVVLSKFDAVTSLLQSDSLQLLQPSPHCNKRKFVTSDFTTVDNEVRAILGAWGANPFMRTMEVNYSNHAYFIASSFGLNNMPESGGYINRPNPHRIEDALLWILYQKNYVDSA